MRRMSRKTIIKSVDGRQKKAFWFKEKKSGLSLSSSAILRTCVNGELTIQVDLDARARLWERSVSMADLRSRRRQRGSCDQALLPKMRV